MSMLTYDKEMTATKVKSKERGDVDITRLVKHGAARILPPAPLYADLTQLPASRGEAAALLMHITRGYAPDFIKQLLRLPPAQALQALNNIRPPASNVNDKTNTKEQGPDTKSKTKAEEPPK